MKSNELEARLKHAKKKLRQRKDKLLSKHRSETYRKNKENK